MPAKRFWISTAIVMVLSALLALPAYAQSPGPVSDQTLGQRGMVIEAQVDRTTLSTDEWLTLTVAIDAFEAMLAEPRLPALDGFEVIGTSTSTEMSLNNGRATVKDTYIYQLRPTEAGEWVIGSIEVNAQGRVYRTDPIRVTVTQGTGKLQPAPSPSWPPSRFNLPSLGPMPSLPLDDPSREPMQPMDPADASPELKGQDFFVEARVDNPTPYQGEQVIYTFRFYRAVTLLDQPEYEGPAFTGFWHERQAEQQDYTLQASGRTYRVAELQSVLFSMVAGPVDIDAARIALPGGLFSQGQVLRTRPISLDVRPLPAGAPADYQGAVGRFTIGAEVDTVETQVNEAVTLRVTLSGQGNIASLPDPVWTEGSEWRAFDSKASVDARLQDGVLVGSRTYERVLVPTVPGQLVLPPIHYSTFDPETETYHTVSTEASEMNVAPDGSAATMPGPAPMPGAATAPAGGHGQPVGLAPGAGIRPIKPTGEAGKNHGAPLTQRSAYWVLWAVPPMLLAGQFAWQQRRKQWRDNATTRRSQQAAKVARQALRQVRPGQAHVRAAQILSDYLGDKLDRPVASWTQTRLAEALLERGVRPELVERVQTCLMLGEMGRYAPAAQGSAGSDLLAETKELIDELEKTL